VTVFSEIKVIKSRFAGPVEKVDYKAEGRPSWAKWRYALVLTDVDGEEHTFARYTSTKREAEAAVAAPVQDPPRNPMVINYQDGVRVGYSETFSLLGER